MSSQQPPDFVIESLKDLKQSFAGLPVERQRVRTSSYVIGFEVDSSALLVEHTEALSPFIATLRDYPASAVVSVVGRASQTGPEASNRQLARDRADRVRAYLIASGVPEDRVGPVVFHGSEGPTGQPAGARGRDEPQCRARNRVGRPRFRVGVHGRWDHRMAVGPDRNLRPRRGHWRSDADRDTDEPRHRSEQDGDGHHLRLGYRGFAVRHGGRRRRPAVSNEGVFSMPTPPGPVDFDWFDGRFIVLASVGGSAIVGGVDVAALRFYNSDGPWPEATFADYPIGVTLGVGGVAMIGYFNVDL